MNRTLLAAAVALVAVAFSPARCHSNTKYEMLTGTTWEVQTSGATYIVPGALFLFKPDGNLELSGVGRRNVWKWKLVENETSVVIVENPLSRIRYNIRNLTSANLTLFADAASNGLNHSVTLTLVPEIKVSKARIPIPIIGRYSLNRPNGMTERVEETFELKSDGTWELRWVFSVQKSLDRLQNAGTYAVSGSVVTINWLGEHGIRTERCEVHRDELRCDNTTYRKERGRRKRIEK